MDLKQVDKLLRLATKHLRQEKTPYSQYILPFKVKEELYVPTGDPITWGGKSGKAFNYSVAKIVPDSVDEVIVRYVINKKDLDNMSKDGFKEFIDEFFTSQLINLDDRIIAVKRSTFGFAHPCHNKCTCKDKYTQTYIDDVDGNTYVAIMCYMEAILIGDSYEY